MCRKKTTTLVSYVLADKLLVVMASPSATISPLMFVTTAFRRGEASSKTATSTSEGASQGVEDESSVVAERIVLAIPRRQMAAPPVVVDRRQTVVVGANASDQPADAASNATDAIALKIPIAVGTFDAKRLPFRVFAFSSRYS